VLRDAKETVELEAIANILRISFESDDKKSTFDLKLMDIDVDMLSIPEVEYDYIAHMPSSEFVRTCRSCFGDTMEVQVNTALQFTSKGDMGSSSVSYTDAVVKQSGEISMEFSSRYLEFFAKGASLSKAVVLSMSADIPLRVEFGFEGGHLQYFLAPKIVD
jgi:proliferating cell nuclear antigen